MTTIQEKALAFATSYATAMSLSQPPTPASASTIASALGSHFATPNFTSFSLGTITTSGSDSPIPGIEAYLHLLDASGLGYRIHHPAGKLEVKVVSDHAACVWMTWRIEPKEESGEEGWEWTNVYGFRDGEKRDGVEVPGKWEFAISDQEIEGFLKRRPGMFGGSF